MPDNVTALAVVPTADPSRVNAQDLIFLQSAQMSNLTEVAEAKLALQNSTNIESRVFARWMIGDHTAQIATLSALAEQLGVTLPSSPGATQQSEIDQLSALNGSAFDQAYGPPAVQDHAQTIGLFLQEAAGGENPALVALAQQSLPLLNAHYEQAEVLASLSPTPYPGVGPAPAPNIPATPTTLSAQDQTFVMQAATSGLAEIAERQLAEQRGNTASSEFGRWMVADHTAVNASLATIARQEGFTLPTMPTPTQQDELTSLSKAANFDGVYSSNQVMDHVKTLMTFIKEAQSGSDPALVAFARSAIPTLEQHLAGAAELGLSNAGISLPTGDSLGSLSTILTSGFEHDGRNLLSDIAKLPNQSDAVSVSNNTLHVGSLSIDGQQIAHLFATMQS